MEAGPWKVDGQMEISIALVLLLSLLFTSRVFRRALGCMILSVVLLAILTLFASLLAAHA
jgi:hypothetical protein